MNNQAPELSPEARRLISAARGADDPTPEDQARVKARWLASVAAVAGVSSLTEAARAAGGIGWGLKAAGAALVIAAGAVGLNFALDDGTAEPKTAESRAAESKAAESKAASPLPGIELGSPERFQKTPPARRASEDPAAATPPSSADAIDAEPVTAEPIGLEPSTVTPPPSVGSPALLPSEQIADARPILAVAPAAGATAAGGAMVATPKSTVRARPVARASAARASTQSSVEKRAAEKKAAEKPAAEKPIVEKELAPGPVTVETAAPAAAAQSGQLGEELALLSEVRSSIQDGAGARALELLSRYESRFGQPILGMEAHALRVDALCKAGQREAARESARAFQNEWPGSPLERRVSAACP